MTIGSTINFSIPVVGTTVDTLNKFRESLFSVPIDVGGVDVPIVVQLRAANIQGFQKRFGATWKYNPGVLDASSAVTKGRISVSVNVDATLGSEIDHDELVLHVRYALSTLLASSLLEDLRDGSLV